VGIQHFLVLSLQHISDYVVLLAQQVRAVRPSSSDGPEQLLLLIEDSGLGSFALLSCAERTRRRLLDDKVPGLPHAGAPLRFTVGRSCFFGYLLDRRAANDLLELALIEVPLLAQGLPQVRVILSRGVRVLFVTARLTRFVEVSEGKRLLV